MTCYSTLMASAVSPDPHRPITQWNGQHVDQFGNHVLCGPDGLRQIETPRAEFRRKLTVDDLREAVK